MNEKTDKLTKRKTRPWIIVLAVLLLLVLGAGGYYLYRRVTYTRNLEEGNALMQAGEYEKAAEALKKACDNEIPFSAFSEEPYLDLARAYCLSFNRGEAAGVYEKLYEETQNPRYKYLASAYHFGNFPGNNINGGFAVQNGDTLYLAYTPADGNGLLYRMVNDQIEQLPVDPSQGMLNACINGLNINGPDLYYIKGGNQSDKFNIQKNTEDHGSNYHSPFELMFLNDEVYYARGYIGANPARLQDNSLNKSDISGSNDRTLYDYAGNVSSGFIMDESGNVYISVQNQMLTECTLYKIDPEGKAESLSQINRGYIFSMCIADNKLYYVTGFGIPAGFSNELYCLNLEDYTTEVVATGDMLQSVNTDGEKLYYVSAGKCWQCDLSGQNPVEIGDVPATDAPGQKVTSINITDDYLVAVSYTPNIFGNRYTYYTRFRIAPLSDLTQYRDINF